MAKITRLATTITSHEVKKDTLLNAFYLDGRGNRFPQTNDLDITLDRNSLGFYLNIASSRKADATEENILAKRQADDDLLVKVKQRNGQNIDSLINDMAENAINMTGKLNLDANKHERRPYYAGILVKESEMAALTLGDTVALLYRDDALYPLTENDFDFKAKDYHGNKVENYDVYQAGRAGSIKYSNIAQLRVDDCIIICTNNVIKALGQSKLLKLLDEVYDQQETAEVIHDYMVKKHPDEPYQFMMSFVEDVYNESRRSTTKTLVAKDDDTLATQVFKADLIEKVAQDRANEAKAKEAEAEKAEAKKQAEERKQAEARREAEEKRKAEEARKAQAEKARQQKAKAEKEKQAQAFAPKSEPEADKETEAEKQDKLAKAKDSGIYIDPDKDTGYLKPVIEAAAAKEKADKEKAAASQDATEPEIDYDEEVFEEEEKPKDNHKNRNILLTIIIILVLALLLFGLSRLLEKRQNPAQNGGTEGTSESEVIEETTDEAEGEDEEEESTTSTTEAEETTTTTTEEATTTTSTEEASVATYQVESGDSLYKIIHEVYADDYDLDVDNEKMQQLYELFYQANEGTITKSGENNYMIYAGTSIKIPDPSEILDAKE